METVVVNNDVEEEEVDDGLDAGQICASVICIFFIILTFPFTIWGTIVVVSEYQRAVAFRLGKLVRGPPKRPGVHFIIPCLDEIRVVDMRTKSCDVPSQEILTKDAVSVAVDAVMFYHVYNPTLVITEVEDVDEATILVGQTTLRNVLGNKTLSEILSGKDAISDEMSVIIDQATDEWGIKVERVELKDVRLPYQLQRTMASEAEASRGAKAKVLMAEGETNASRKLKEAADIMASSPYAIKLRYLQTLNTISAKQNETIILPIQTEIMKNLLQRLFG